MLETFCNSQGIKLIWSTWSNALTDSDETFLHNNFKNYFQDKNQYGYGFGDFIMGKCFFTMEI
jgi:hypothetical protein